MSRRRPRVERKSASIGAAGELGPGLAEVAGDPVRRLLAERDDPVLRALAVADVDVLLLEVDVAEIEPDRLGAAQAGRVDELEQRAVADPERDLRSPSASARIASTSSDLRRVGQPPAAALGASGTSGTAPGPSEKRSSARTAESRRAIVARRELAAGPRAAEVGRVVGEHADVDPLELAVRRTSSAKSRRSAA